MLVELQVGEEGTVFLGGKGWHSTSFRVFPWRHSWLSTVEGSGGTGFLFFGYGGLLFLRHTNTASCFYHFVTSQLNSALTVLARTGPPHIALGLKMCRHGRDGGRERIYLFLMIESLSNESMSGR